MTCKDCIHYNVCQFHIDEETPFSITECNNFKNKADFVEVVRCGKCKFAQHYKCVDPCYNHMRCTRREHYTEGVDEYDYCSYGERTETHGV